MAPSGRIDRTKHEVDITEQVSRGVRTEDAPTSRSGARADVRQWLAGHVVSAVHVEVLNRGGEDPDDNR